MRVSNQTHSVNHATISGMNCTVRGHHNTVSGMGAVVYGDYNVVSGMNAVVRGNRNTVSGMNAKAYGEGNVVTGMGSESNGTKTESKNTGFDISGTTFKLYGNGTTIFTVDGDNNFGKSVPEPQYVEGPAEAELSHDVEGDGCVVCLSNRPICIVWPCRHACLCVKCARTLCFGQNGDPQEVGTVKCPKCRGATEKILRIHE